MRRLSVLLALAVLMVAGGCAGLKAGRMFPSPDPAQIIVNVTDKAALVRMFGEPYQVGLDSGDPTWRWFYAAHDAGGEVSKDFSVRFNPNGTVKAYSFTSNFPDDMKKLREGGGGDAQHHDPVVRGTHPGPEAAAHGRHHGGDGEDRQDDARSGPHRLPGRREVELGLERQARERLINVGGSGAAPPEPPPHRRGRGAPSDT